MPPRVVNRRIIGNLTPDNMKFSEANRRSHLVAEAPCGNRRLCNLVGVVLADPVLDVSADFGG